MKIINIIFNKFKNQWLIIKNRQLAVAFNIKSHLTIEEIIRLNILTRKHSIVLEIGSYLGASTCSFGSALKMQGIGTIFCIDTWKNDAMSEGARDTFSEFLKNTSPFAEFIVPIRGFSNNVFSQVQKKTAYVDILFIDGDHSYNSVKADWETYKYLLKPGSIIVFHDWGWAEGVRQVIEEDVKPNVSTFDSLPNMWWGIIKNGLC